MDRLISLEPSNLVAIKIEHGEKCRGKIVLRNVMYTMPVAFKLQPVNNNRYTICPQSGIISPLATLTVEITYEFPQMASDLPDSLPYSDDSFLLHSVVVPGAALKNTSSTYDIVPNDWFTTKKKQVFIDSGIKIMFVGSPVLALLVADGLMDDVREVLDKSDPSWKPADSIDSDGQTLLHLAIAQSRPDLVQLILEFDPNIEAQNRQGLTPLEAASASGESLIVELLLAHRANTERSDSSNWGPIHLAARAGHMDILRLLILKGAKVNALTKDGTTALQLAVEERRRDCARLLLASGAKPDGALHVAAATGDEQMVKLLLQKGAHKDMRNKSGKTAYDLAAEYGHARLFDALRLGDALCVASRKGEVRTIQRLLESGAVINGKDQHGWTALHRASFKGRVDSVRALIEKGIDLDAKDEDGYTALHCAAESGHADIIELLIKKGSDVDARTNKGVSALQIAESLHYSGITRILVHAGANKDGGGGASVGATAAQPATSLFGVGNRVEKEKDVRVVKKKKPVRARALRCSFDRSVPLAVV